VQQQDWYDTPQYYDIVFDGGTAQETSFLHALHERYAQGKAQVSRALLEPACGSGRLIASMSQAGWSCSGFDANTAMLDYAKARCVRDGITAQLWHDQMQSFRAKGQRYGLAHCLVSTFKYLLTEADAVAHLQALADHLLPGGVYVLGIHLTDYSQQRMQHERWTELRDGVNVVCNTRTWPADSRTRLEAVRTRLRVTENGTTRTQETHWQFRTYDAKQVKTLLRKVPQLKLCGCYDFQHDADQPRSLDDSYSDVVMVLRRERGKGH
jgi:SAM-dependent methyltransferase